MTNLIEKAFLDNYYNNFIAILPIYKANIPSPKLHNGYNAKCTKLAWLNRL